MPSVGWRSWRVCRHSDSSGGGGTSTVAVRARGCGDDVDLTFPEPPSQGPDPAGRPLPYLPTGDGRRPFDRCRWTPQPASTLDTGRRSSVGDDNTRSTFGPVGRGRVNTRWREAYSPSSWHRGKPDAWSVFQKVLLRHGLKALNKHLAKRGIETGTQPRTRSRRNQGFEL